MVETTQPVEQDRHGPVMRDDVVVSVEAVTKVYRPLPPPGRVLRMLMRVGGGGAYRDRIGGDDDEDDDVGLDDAEGVLEEEAPGGQGVVALAGVSFTVTGGSCVALVGPARAGKSTLLRIVAGLAPPTHGRVVLAGRVAPVLDELMRALPSQLPLRKAVLVLATIARLPRREIAHHLPEAFLLPGLAGLEDRLVSNTPSKRRRQLMLTVMSATQPLVLLYDGPMSAGIRDLLRREIDAVVAAGGAAVVTARDLESVPFADRIVYLQDGAIVADGTPAEVLDELRRRRTAGTDVAGLPLGEDAARYAEFLRVALGIVALEDALHRAAAAAAANGAEQVEWEDLAAAAGVGVEDARTVVERLRSANAPQYRQRT